MATQDKTCPAQDERHQPRAPIIRRPQRRFTLAAVHRRVRLRLSVPELRAARLQRLARVAPAEERATEMMHKQDLEGATAAAQQMLQIRPDSLAAFQILADTTEKQNRAETVAWRAQIARLLPHNSTRS